MVNLHIVPIVPKMGGHLTIVYATGRYTPHWEQRSLSEDETWHRGFLGSW